MSAWHKIAHSKQCGGMVGKSPCMIRTENDDAEPWVSEKRCPTPFTSTPGPVTPSGLSVDRVLLPPMRTQGSDFVGMTRKIKKGSTVEERQRTRTSAVLPGYPVADSRIAASIKLIESALEKGVRTSDVARKLGLSPSRFGHVFRTQTGLTFRQYVRTARLARAKLLL